MSVALPAPYRLLRGNVALSRIVGGEGFSSLADWLLAVVLTVIVYRISHSGTTVALLSFARLAPYGLVLPWSGLALDRGDRRLLFASLGIGRALCMLGLLIVDSQATLPLVFPLVFASSSLSCLLRPAINSTLPSIVSDDETVSANSLVGQVDGAAHIIGPALGGAFILGGAARLALLVAASSFLLSGVALYLASAQDSSRAPQPSGELSLTEVLAGFRYILRENERVLVALTLTAAGLALVAGAYYALAVVLCTTTFHLGGQGVGWLDAMFGVGNVAGGLAIGLVVRGRRVVRFFVMGAALSSLGVALLAVSPPGLAPFACIVLVGIASVAVQITGTTIMQAAAPPDMLGRVFTAFEATLVVATLLGALTVGPLLRLTSPRGATLAFAFAGAVLLLVSLPLLRGLEDVLGLRVFLRSVPLLAELPRSLLDELAPRFDAVTFPAGAAIIQEGEPGDRFYVIRDGEVVVSIGGHVIRTLGPAAYFGEVALLRDVPRTASVSASSEAQLYSLDRAGFDALMRRTDGLWTSLARRADRHYTYAPSALLRH